MCAAAEGTNKKKKRTGRNGTLANDKYATFRHAFTALSAYSINI